MRGALSSTSPTGLQSPPWGWSKLIPSPVLTLPVRRQQKSVPSRAVCRHGEFYPTPGTRMSPKCPNGEETTHLAETLKPSQISSSSKRALPHSSRRTRASPAHCREPSAALFMEIHPAHQPWSCRLAGTSPEGVCSPSKRAGQQRHRSQCHGGSDNIRQLVAEKSGHWSRTPSRASSSCCTNEHFSLDHASCFP